MKEKREESGGFESAMSLFLSVLAMVFGWKYFMGQSQDLMHGITELGQISSGSVMGVGSGGTLVGLGISLFLILLKRTPEM